MNLNDRYEALLRDFWGRRVDVELARALGVRSSPTEDPVAKSRKLLLENLTLEQRGEFERDGTFKVDVDGETYELRPDITERLSDKARFCAVVPGLPVYDQMLARKLHLERDPESFFKVANNLTAPRQADWTRQRAQVGRPPQSRELYEYFQIAMMHAFRERGMDARLLEVVVADVDFRHSVEVRVRYAECYQALSMVDCRHLQFDNLAEIVRQQAGLVASRINEMVEGRSPRS